MNTQDQRQNNTTRPGSKPLGQCTASGYPGSYCFHSHHLNQH